MKLMPEYLFAMTCSEIGGNKFSLFSSFCYSNLELSYMFMCSGPVQATKINKYCGFNCVEWQQWTEQFVIIQENLCQAVCRKNVY